MKYVRSFTFRALCAMGVGALLIAFPDKTTSWLVRTIGVLFLIPGMVSIFAYFRLRTLKTVMQPFFPIIGLGCLMFGLVLIVFSDRLVDYMRYAMGAFLVVAGVGQLVNLIKYRSRQKVGPFFYVVSLLIVLSGLFVLIYQEGVPSLYYNILGVTSIVYGLEELVASIYFRKVRRMMSIVSGEPEVSKVCAQTPADAEPLPEKKEAPEQEVSNESDPSRVIHFNSDHSE